MSDTIQCSDSLQPFYMWHDAFPMENVDTCKGVPLDSIFAAVGRGELVVRQSLFSGHELVQNHTDLTVRSINAAPAWVFVVVVLLCAALCLFYNRHKIDIVELLRSTVDMRSAGRLQRIQSLNRTGAMVPVALILAAAMALVIWAVAMPQIGLGGYLLLALVLAVAYLLRNSLLRLLAAVFDRQSTMSTYRTIGYLHHLLLSTAVVPMLFVVVYVPNAQNAALWTVGILTILVFFLRFSKGVQLFLTKTQGFSLFLFYYLCTVEVIPLLVLLKWFISQ